MIGLLIHLFCFDVPLAMASVGVDTKVGVYLFVWYGNADGTGGLGSPRWNDTSAATIIDKPIIGFYSSCNVTAVRWQIQKMTEAGIDFVVISWWGPNDYTDLGAKTFLEADAAEGWPLEFCLLVEPYDEPMDYNTVYNYIETEFLNPFSDHYFNRNEKPLLLFFNPADPTNTNIFEVHVVGDCHLTEPQEDWQVWVGQGVDVFNKSGVDEGLYPPWVGSETERISSDGMCPVIVRYDDYYVYKAGGRTGYMRLDPDYSEGVGDRQMIWALTRASMGEVNLILIYGWNDYPVRAAIEPHTDKCGADPYLAYNKVKNYISQLKGGTIKFKTLNIAVILEGDLNSTQICDFIGWVESLPQFTEWTFIVWQPYTILDNSSFASWMKQRGEIIPASGYYQNDEPDYRISKPIDGIDVTMETWQTKLGASPKGFFMFQPDTYVANYLRDVWDCSYVCGYCFDQYLIDWMTMRGGWQMPYYSNPAHVNAPNNTGSLVILPHLLWDWEASLTVNHHLNTHPIGAYCYFNNFDQARVYVETLIEEQMNQTDPGYAITMTEWRSMIWLHPDRKQRMAYVKQLYGSLINASYAKIMLNDTALWFKANYPQEPEYHFTFTSPKTGATVEWLHNSKCRVARVGDTVMSYVDYRDQLKDPWLASSAMINFNGERTPDNSIDTSLRFTIDDLGGGTERAPRQYNSKIYLAKLNLTDFPKFYRARARERFYTFVVVGAAGIGFTFLLYRQRKKP